MTERTIDCDNCPGEHDKTHYSYWECDNCNEPIRPTETVPKEDLEALVERWREEGHEKRKNSRNDMARLGEGCAYENCADELAELIDS